MGVSRIATNAELWNFARHIDKNFANVTPEGTADLFTERGWTALTQNGYSAINDFWGILVPFYLAQIDIAKARDPFDKIGFGAGYGDLPGGAIQKMAMNSIKPISPAYRNLQNGKGPDPFVVRKPEAHARYFKYNFDYQNLITIPDEWQTKTLFLRNYGFSEFMAGIFQGLKNGYTMQKASAKYEVLNAALNNDEFPMQDTQRILISMSDTPTDQELLDFTRTVMDLGELMSSVTATPAFNSDRHDTLPDEDELFLFVRPGFESRVKLQLVRGSYNADTLTLPIKVKSILHFGGVVPYKEEAFTTRLYPVYDDLGEMIGFNEAEGQTTVTVTTEDAYYKDPNEKVFAIMASTRAMITANHNSLRVEPIRNPRGLYTNEWASAPDNGIWYDPEHTFVAFTTDETAGMAINEVMEVVTNGAKAK